MGTHKEKSFAQWFKRRVLGIKRPSKLMPPAEAAGYRAELAEFYRKHGLEMHALQTNPSSAPSAEVVAAVQGSSKGDPTTFFGSGYRNALRIFEELEAHGFDVAKAARVLDFGVGTARVLLHFLPFAAERHGCDVNPAAVEWSASALGGHADIRLSQMEPPLPYDDAMFDLVIGMSVFTHIPVQAQPSWIAELARIIRPGGFAVVTIHDFSKMKAAGDSAEKGADRGLHMNAFLARQKVEEFWGKAYDVLEVRRFPPKQAHLIVRRKAALA